MPRSTKLPSCLRFFYLCSLWFATERCFTFSILVFLRGLMSPLSIWDAVRPADIAFIGESFGISGCLKADLSRLTGLLLVSSLFKLNEGRILWGLYSIFLLNLSIRDKRPTLSGVLPTRKPTISIGFCWLDWITICSTWFDVSALTISFFSLLTLF